MKKLILCSLIFCSPLIVAQTKITPPNMDLGYWVTSVDQSGIIESALLGVPEESRAMVREMMAESMQESMTTEQCITEETLSNFDGQIEDAFSGDSDCEFNVTESSSEKFMATISCPGSVMQITTDVINSKRNESIMVSKVAGMAETEITSIAEWQSSVCPADL